MLGTTAAEPDGMCLGNDACLAGNIGGGFIEF